MLDYVIALVPPIGLFLILLVILRAFLGADRSERAAEKEFREEHPDLDLEAFTVDRRPVGRGGPAARSVPAKEAEQGANTDVAAGSAASAGEAPSVSTPEGGHSVDR